MLEKKGFVLAISFLRFAGYKFKFIGRVRTLQMELMICTYKVYLANAHFLAAL